MLKWFISAAITIAGNLALYPFMQTVAYNERGYEAVGGEYVLFITGFIIAAILAYRGFKERKKERTARERLSPADHESEG